MAGDATNPEVGERVFDGSEFTYLKDITPREMLGLRTAQLGLEEVLKEIRAHQAEWGGKAGLTADDFAELETISQRIARIDAFIAPVQKFLEMLTETRYLLEDKRQRFVLNLASSVDRRGKENPDLLAKYEQTRNYRSAAAKKALKTRLKNAEQPQEEEQDPPAPSQPMAN